MFKAKKKFRRLIGLLLCCVILPIAASEAPTTDSLPPSLPPKPPLSDSRENTPEYQWLDNLIHRLGNDLTDPSITNNKFIPDEIKRLSRKQQETLKYPMTEQEIKRWYTSPPTRYEPFFKHWELDPDKGCWRNTCLLGMFGLCWNNVKEAVMVLKEFGPQIPEVIGQHWFNQSGVHPRHIPQDLIHLIAMYACYYAEYGDKYTVIRLDPTDVTNRAVTLDYGAKSMPLSIKGTLLWFENNISSTFMPIGYFSIHFKGNFMHIPGLGAKLVNVLKNVTVTPDLLKEEPKRLKKKSQGVYNPAKLQDLTGVLDIPQWE